MKSILFALFILFFIVFAVQVSDASLTNDHETFKLKTPSLFGIPQPRQSFTKILYNLMYSSIELSIKEVQLIQEKTEGIYNQVFDQILKLLENTNDMFNGILTDYDNHFAGDNNRVHPCVEKHMDVLVNAVENGRNNSFICIKKASEQVDNIRESLAPYVESIDSLLKIMSRVSNECSQSSNTIVIGICIIKNLEVVSESVSAINHDSNEAARLVTVQIYGIGQNAQGCIQSVIDSTKKEVEDIVAVVNECAVKYKN